MLKKVAAVLLAASMITAPVVALAGTTPPAKTAQPTKADVKATKIVKVKKFKRHYVKKMKRGKHVRHARVKPGKNVKQLRIKRIEARKTVPAQAVTKPAPKATTSGQR
jgi:hypothetical protein